MDHDIDILAQNLEQEPHHDAEQLKPEWTPEVKQLHGMESKSRI